VERTSEVTLDANVAEVDYEARTLTLADNEGYSQTFSAIREDVPLEKLKVGDAVSMTIYQKEINYVAEASAETRPDETIRTVGAKKGAEDESISIINVQQMTSTVKEIDPETRMLTLVDASGTPLTLHVQDDVENLDQLEVGDQVVTETRQLISIMVKK
jgi:Cu/Ag efflux protein CusF